MSDQSESEIEIIESNEEEEEEEEEEEDTSSEPQDESPDQKPSTSSVFQFGTGANEHSFKFKLGLSQRHKQRQVHSKRSHHNALERKRRDHIKDCFSGLQETLPNIVDVKASRLLILEEAVRRIQKCQKERGEVQKMREMNDTMQAQIDTLEDALGKKGRNSTGNSRHGGSTEESDESEEDEGEENDEDRDADEEDNDDEDEDEDEEDGARGGFPVGRRK